MTSTSVVKIIILFLIVNVTAKVSTSTEDYVDAVIYMLLNGESVESDLSDENAEEQEPVLAGGIWKCGLCQDIGDSKLVYSEVNEFDSDMPDDESIDIQIGLTLTSMKCVTVSADTTGIVRRLSGACSGSTVTLNVAPAHHFTVRVYD